MDWLSLSIPCLTMRTRLISFALLALTCVPAIVYAEEEFPYPAYVSQEGAYVRSGPGQRYYPTGQVPQGYAVVVYRHDKSGWCAIRPTGDSFSWVSAHEVKRVDAQVAEVIAEQTIARVGSTLSPVRSAVQVMLPRGERVAVLAAGPNDDPRWLRIVAPAGEFRWVAAQNLSLRPPIEVSPPSPSNLGWGQINRTPTTAPAIAAPADEFAHLRNPENLRQSQPIGIAQQPATALPFNPENVEIITGSPAEAQLAQYQAQSQNLSPPQLLNQAAPLQAAPPVAKSTAPRVRFPDLTASLGEKSEDVATLELLLSQMVVQQPPLWELSPLEAEANDLLAKTNSSAERVQLRELLNRITRFQQVQQEYNNPVANPLSRPAYPSANDEVEQKEQPSKVVSNVRERVKQDLRGASRPGSNSSNATTNPLYDAVGKLKPVVSKREQAPPYALVNGKGEVVSFVTPTPDLNLQPYVGRRIGIQGNRGFMPEYRKAHVTAGRVLPLEDQLRR